MPPTANCWACCRPTRAKALPRWPAGWAWRAPRWWRALRGWSARGWWPGMACGSAPRSMAAQCGPGARLDPGTVRACCSITVLPKTPPAVLRALQAMAEVEEVSAVSGPFDYLVFLRCASHEQLDALLDRVGQFDGVHQTQTSIVLSRKIDRRSVGA